MHRLDVIKLEEYLEECLPVEWALVNDDLVENVLRVVVVGCERKRGKIRRRVARPRKQQPVPFRQRCAWQRAIGCQLEVRRTQQAAVEIVGPAVAADNVLMVAAAFEQQSLSVTTGATAG
jgi:hypothetical protein